MADASRSTNVEPTETERLQVERARLECDKLRAEITQTSLAWWKRPTNLASVATLAALLTGWLSGYFPGEREVLRKQVADLRTQTTAFHQERVAVNTDLARLRADRDDLAKQADAVQKRLQTEMAALKAAQTTAAQDLTRLRGERDGFVRENTKLADEAKATQRRIDDTYLRLKLLSAHAVYALSHLQPNRDSAETRARLGSSVARLPTDLAGPVQRMLDNERLTEDIVKITEKELNGLRKELQTIPASPWAVRLVPDIDGKLYEPDRRRYYDLTDGKFHDKR